MTENEKRRLRFRWHRLRQWRMALALVFFAAWLVLTFTVPYEHNRWLSVAVYGTWAVAMLFGVFAKRDE